MTAVAFDTLKFAQNLRDKANFSPTQAEGISQAFSEAITGQLVARADIANLATKDDLAQTRDDLAAFRLETRNDFAALRLQTKDEFGVLAAKIDASKSETLKWIVSALGFQTIVTIGTVFGLLRPFVH
jgi:hypothetical protein